MTKAQIFSVKRFAVHDGDGIRTTVFFKGCPLRCLWCHNPEGLCSQTILAFYSHKCVSCGECARVCPNNAHTIIDGKHIFDRTRCKNCGLCENVCMAKALQLFGREVTVDELLPILTEDRDFYETSGGGVTLSGGEALCQSRFCAEILEKLRENGISTALDTSGYVEKSDLDRVIPFTDVFLYDLKAYDEEVHKRCTGVSNKKILENLCYLDSLGCKTEIRIPFVPQYNDGELPKIAKFLSGLSNVTGVRVLAYHDFARSKYASLGYEDTMPKVPIPDEKELDMARKIIADYGTKVIK